MLNQVNLIGNVGNAPEFSDRNGLAIARFSLATSSRNKNGETETEWHRIVFFGRTAEVVRDYLKKGDKAYVCGRLKTTKYTDKNGIERYATEIRANNLQFLTSKKEREERENANGGNSAQAQNGHVSNHPTSVYDMEEDAPF